MTKPISAFSDITCSWIYAVSIQTEYIEYLQNTGRIIVETDLYSLVTYGGHGKKSPHHKDMRGRGPHMQPMVPDRWRSSPMTSTDLGLRGLDVAEMVPWNSGRIRVRRQQDIQMQFLYSGLHSHDRSSHVNVRPCLCCAHELHDNIPETRERKHSNQERSSVWVTK